MRKVGIRVAIAILTFVLGVAIMWPARLIRRFEAALVDRFYPDSGNDLIPAALTVDPAVEANEVYRVVIRSMYQDQSKNEPIVLQSETEGCRICTDDFSSLEADRPESFYKMIKETMPDAERQTLDDYLLRNKVPGHLKVWNVGLNVVLTDLNGFESDRPDRFWLRFSEKYPKAYGFASFSNIGFNDRYDQAFLYAARSCGGLCGSGGYVLLKKINGKWEIQSEAGMWIS